MQNDETARTYIKPDPRNEAAAQLAVPGGFTGMTMPWFAEAIPAGFLKLDGASYRKDEYPELYDLLGATFDVDAELFFVPDMRDRVPVGVGSDVNFNALHKKPGAATHTLTVNEIPSHNHAISRPPWRSAERAASNKTWGPDAGTYDWVVQVSTGEGGIANTGGGRAHNNVQPSYAVHWIIKT